MLHLVDRLLVVRLVLMVVFVMKPSPQDSPWASVTGREGTEAGRASAAEG